LLLLSQPSAPATAESASLRVGLALLLSLAAGCGSTDTDDDSGRALIAVTFNTGTTTGLPHSDPPDDGYGSVQADYSDQHYGDGLAWKAAISDARQFFERVAPDIVAFQEMFFSGECEAVPAEAQPGFVCEDWQSGDPTVAELVLGSDYQVACHLGKPDKCLAVKRSFGSFSGCDSSLCLDGLDGAAVPDCGSGSRIGRGRIQLEGGGTLTVVNIHGTSGITQEDQDCRAKQFSQVFIDLDGAPAADGERNLILGDLNTDPGRTYDFDESAALFNEFVGQDKPFHYLTDVGPDVPPTYAELFNIDHVASDALRGNCWVAGHSEGHPPVTEMTYFDHKPVVCRLSGS
jgi:hypothetical protein